MRTLTDCKLLEHAHLFFAVLPPCLERSMLPKCRGMTASAGPHIHPHIHRQACMHSTHDTETTTHARSPQQERGSRACQQEALLSSTKVSASGCKPDWSSLRGANAAAWHMDEIRGTAGRSLL